MRYLLIMCMVLLVLAACQTNAEPPVEEHMQEEEEMPEQENVTPSDPEEPAEVAQEPEKFSDVEELEEVVRLSDQLRIYSSSKRVDAGETVRFAIAATNPLNNPKGLIREVTFKGASDTRGNTIVTEEDAMRQWLLSSPVTSFEVPSTDVVIEVLEFRAGNIGEAQVAIPGTYTFTVELREQGSGEPRYSRADLAIRVN